MTAFLFPDNTVLCNFAAVERLDLREGVLLGRGRWTAAVADEAAASARYLPALVDLARQGWLGDPVEVTEPSEIRKINRIRRVVFGGTDEAPRKHLGEAETCFVIKEWSEFRRGHPFPQLNGQIWTSNATSGQVVTLQLARCSGSRSAATARPWSTGCP